MAINKNHEFEELDGVKCSIVEKNAGPARVAFLKSLLEYNKFTVIVVPSPPAKAAAVPPKPVTPETVKSDAPPNAAAVPPKPVAPEAEKSDVPVPVTAESTVGTPSTTEVVSDAPPPAPETYTVGVTDYTFNTINAIFGRLLKTPDGHIVTQAYWNQKENESHDEVPYYEKN